MINQLVCKLAYLGICSIVDHLSRLRRRRRNAFAFIHPTSPNPLPTLSSLSSLSSIFFFLKKKKIKSPPNIPSRILHHNRRQPFRALHIHRLHVTVQLLLGALLVVPFPRNAHPQPERHALDAGFPDFFVELRVEADVAGALWIEERKMSKREGRRG